MSIIKIKVLKEYKININNNLKEYKKFSAFRQT